MKTINIKSTPFGWQVTPGAQDGEYVDLAYHNTLLYLLDQYMRAKSAGYTDVAKEEYRNLEVFLGLRSA